MGNSNLVKCWGGGGGVTSDGLAPHPGGVAILPVASCNGQGPVVWITRLVCRLYT